VLLLTPWHAATAYNMSGAPVHTQHAPDDNAAGQQLLARIMGALVFQSTVRQA